MAALRRLPRVGVLAGIAALIVAAYWPFLSMPFISDDYLQIQLGRKYGAVEQWGSLMQDPLYRCRATSILLTRWLDETFGLNPFAFNLASLVLHWINAGLVLMLGSLRRIGYATSTVAAVIFAVYETHQEAVVWHSAVPELLQLTFALGCVLCFVRIAQSGKVAPGLYTGSVALFVLALLSKESAVAVVPLLGLVLVATRTVRQRWPLLIPFALIACIYTALVFLSAKDHLHFNDAGTFSLKAPFLMVWANSFVRSLWIWGAIAFFALWFGRRRRTFAQGLFALGWIGIALIPYSFLTYMNRVPSRHVYFAGVGVALLFASAVLVRSWTRTGRQAGAVALIAFIVISSGYLWTRKTRQYRERAEVTEKLISAAASQGSPLEIQCFPYGPELTTITLEVVFHRKAVLSRGSDPTRGISLCSESQFAQGNHRIPLRLEW
jgi:hypothetical protein